MAQVLAPMFLDVIARKLLPENELKRTNTSALLRDLRQWHGDHDEVMSFFNCLISVIDSNEHALSERCRNAISELLCQCADAVQQDKIKQQEETLWEQNKQRRTT